MIRALGTVLLSALPLSTAVPAGSVAVPSAKRFSALDFTTKQRETGIVVKARRASEPTCIAALLSDGKDEDAWLEDGRAGYQGSELVFWEPHSIDSIGVMRLVQDEDGARLERAVFRFDRTTRKLNVAREVTVPLSVQKNVNEPGMTVYGYRSQSALHVLVLSRGDSTLIHGDRGDGDGFIGCKLADLRLPLDTKGTFVQLSAEADRPKPRDVRLHASLTKTSRDTEPVLSITITHP